MMRFYREGYKSAAGSATFILLKKESGASDGTRTRDLRRDRPAL